MKPLLAGATALFLIAAAAMAQQSPAATESVTIAGKNITIAYSAPKVNGREGKLFGSDGRIAKDRTYPEIGRASCRERV